MRQTRSITVAAVLGFITVGFSASAAGNSAAGDIIECGGTLDGDREYTLTKNLNCGCGAPAITLVGPARLDLGGKTVSCRACDSEDDKDHGILVKGAHAALSNGTIRDCDDGVHVAETEGEGDEYGRHVLTKLVSKKNIGDGFEIRSSYNGIGYNKAVRNQGSGFLVKSAAGNTLLKNVAVSNGEQGIIMDEGDSNTVVNNTAQRNCRDGIEIDNAEGNVVIGNLSRGNGSNPHACPEGDRDRDDNGINDYLFGINFRPWFYAGLDITGMDADEPMPNLMFENSAHNNRGCWVPPEERVNGDDSVVWIKCIGFIPKTLGEAVAALRNRNLLDENAEQYDGLAGVYRCESKTRGWRIGPTAKKRSARVPLHRGRGRGVHLGSAQRKCGVASECESVGAT